MAGLIAEAQRDGAVRSDLSPRLVARSLWGALDGIALTWAIGGGEPGQLARAAPQVASLFLEGMRARRELRAIPRAAAGHGGPDDA
jgi:TetR/AcrR family fatty acid metabolism transcriptional regulator